MEEKQAWRMIRERVVLMNRKRNGSVRQLEPSGFSLRAEDLEDPSNLERDGVRLILAFNLLLTALKDARRKLPYPSFLHCLQVANWMYRMGFSVTAQCVGFHHDSVEDGLLTEETIARWLGDDVRAGVSALSRPKCSSVADPVPEYWRKLGLAARQKPEIVAVKLMDQVDNLHSGFFLVHSPERVAEKLAEIRQYLVPLAKEVQQRHPLLRAYVNVLDCWCGEDFIQLV